MPLLRLRFWMLLPLLCACQPEREGAAGATPTAREAAVLHVDLAQMRGNGGECIAAVTRPIDDDLWPYYLHFSKGGIGHSDDPRYREVRRGWDLARPEQPAQVRLPSAALDKSVRLVERPDADPACNVSVTYYQPLFGGDLAFVALDQRVRGMAGGDIILTVYRLEAGRWTPWATSLESYGRPII